MNVKYVMLFAVVLLITTAFLSCSPVKKVAKQITVGSGEIPPEIRKGDFVLLGILRGNKSYDKALQKNFADYKGAYKLCGRDELETTYKDKDQYRYLMDYTVGMGSSPGNGKGMLFKGYRFYILDRKTNRKYKRLSRSSFKNLEIKVYLSAIERELKK